MPITRRLVAQDQDDFQVLKMDSNKRYVVNEDSDWQFLLGPNTTLNNSTQILKIAGEFNAADFTSIRLVGYLYNPATAGVDSSASCTFRIYKITQPNWTETLVTTAVGGILANNYYYANVLLTALPSIDMLGGDTLMVEAIVTRLGETYRDRLYINHLGIYDNAFRLRQDVEWLDLSKLDE